MTKKIAIVGAGLTGLMLSIYLAKRGYSISIYEQRPDPRTIARSQGRSISLDLSVRGLKALAAIGLEQDVLSFSVPMKYRIFHLPDGQLIQLKYDAHERHHINSISRTELHNFLLTETTKYSAIKIYFNQKFIDFDSHSEEMILMDEVKKSCYKISPWVLIGCDGVHSNVRKCIERHLKTSFKINYFGYQYKELTITDEHHHLEFAATHMWPREDFMLVAQPNYHGYLTCALLLPTEGKYTFQSLQNQPVEYLRSFIKEQFGDIAHLVPNFVNEFVNNPAGSLLTMGDGPWHWKNKMMLIGDSAHAMVPFLGQGMNACFEDCYILNQYLDQYHDHWDLVIPEFVKNRKLDTHAIAAMSLENYPELGNLDWQHFILHREIEEYLSKNFNDIYISYHNLVCFHLVPYRYASAVRILQKELIAKIAASIQSINEIKKENIQKELHEYWMKIQKI